MLAAQSLEIPRVKYGLWMGIATLAALALGFGVAMFLGGTQSVATRAIQCVAVASIATLAPVLLRVSASHWGILVMVCGMLRSLAGVGLAYASIGTDNSRPLMLGAVSAVSLLLIVETALAVNILARLDRERSLRTSSADSAGS